MIRTLRGWSARAVLALAVTTAAGCAGAGWEDVMNGGGFGGGGEVRGEVRDVDARSIQVRTDRGTHERVRYDSRTSVAYGGRRYSPRSLERGDVVVMRVNRDSRGDLYTRSISLRRSASASRGGVYDRRTGDRVGRGDRDRDERYDTYGRSAVQGRVGRIDRRNGRFELRDTGRGSIWVSVPRNGAGEVRSRFARLREGQQVRLQGRFLSGNRFEVEGFR